MTIDELLAVLEMQEEILQFTHFTNEDAWELGSAMTLEARRRGLPVLISIRAEQWIYCFSVRVRRREPSERKLDSAEVPDRPHAGAQHPVYLYAFKEVGKRLWKTGFWIPESTLPAEADFPYGLKR